jgi:hypothetical protein
MDVDHGISTVAGAGFQEPIEQTGYGAIAVDPEAAAL